MGPRLPRPSPPTRHNILTGTADAHGAVCHAPAMEQRYEYKVVQVREGLIGDDISPDKLEDVLNKHAEDGWQVKTITMADVEGRVGPGSTEGLLVTFERPVG